MLNLKCHKWILTVNCAKKKYVLFHDALNVCIYVLFTEW